MDKPIDLAQRKQEEYELKAEYARLCRWRKSWLRTFPITDHRITELDKQLEKHPLLKPSMYLAIKRRAIYVLWLEYEDAGAELKRQILLELRELYLALPAHEQKEFWELWWRWLDTFEEAEVANGTRTSRRYVWSPSARLGRL
jgi:hypothetical protein